MEIDDGRALAESWRLVLASDCAPPNTVSNYARAVRQYLDWCEAAGADPDPGDPAAARGWLADAGWKPSSRNTKLASVKTWAAWLVKEGEVGQSALDRIGYAPLTEHIPDWWRAEEEAALLAACDGAAFADVRDKAILSLMIDSLARSADLLGLRDRGDVDLRRREVTYRDTKNHTDRVAGFSPATAVHLDRYQRARRRHPRAASPALWLSPRGGLTRGGLRYVFDRRLAMAGLDGHPQMTRSTGAIKWRQRGGTTEGLMAIGGWKDVRMVVHYTQAADKELALQEAHRLFERG